MIETLRTNAQFARRLDHYGITFEQFADLYARQQGRCDICKQPLTLLGKGKGAIDHCHKHGHVRGLLCAPCNLLLGRLEKRPDPAAFQSYLHRTSLLPPVGRMPRSGPPRTVGRPKNTSTPEQKRAARNARLKRNRAARKATVRGSPELRKG